ncbi:50S Ribosomal protein L22p/L17e [Candidatus Hodgkinia cicadicola]|nr:50S Ribosomal protein L22p/L17e [Candidatus Hodgkinia cicadicola]
MENSHPPESPAYTDVHANALTYSLTLIKYSPKKLKQLSEHLKGEIQSILSFLRHCDRVRICLKLSKFFIQVQSDVASKFGKSKRIFVSECCVGRADISRRLGFAARGKIVYYKFRRANLRIKVLLI